jgi:hypothetical protein
MLDAPAGVRTLWRRLDALLLVILLVARIRIDTLAEAAVLPARQADVARHPWLGRLLSPQATAMLAQQQFTDPIGLLLIVAALGCLLAYLLVHEFVASERPRYWIRLVLIWAMILLTVFAASTKLVLLRSQSGPASYSHDGGVIQTEAAIDYLLQGRNPYVEDYVSTPMAEWGIDEFRTALYHYPYLPWTFLFSAPFRLLADRLAGWYDQRFVYLLLFALTLLLAPGLARRAESKLLLVMILGLNPIMGSDLIYGQNDSFVLAWVLLSLWFWVRSQRVAHGSAAGAGAVPADAGGSAGQETQRGASSEGVLQGNAGRRWLWASAAAFGLACASKPTAWFLLPFYLVLLAGGDARDLWRRPAAWLKRACARGWPALVAAVLAIGPYLVWDPGAMFDDVWRWSNGTSATAYQIWGWGASNLVLAAGWVKSRFDYWPFWLPELIIGLPLLLLLLRRQAHNNTPARAFWSYGLFLLAFFFFSRFLNENYLGYITAVLALGVLAEA